MLAFLLQGRVQGVKMRRYIESAARHLKVPAGFVVNTPQDDVFGMAVLGDDDDVLNDDFAVWLRGDWDPKVYTNVKPTPLGTAYPSLARVDECRLLNYAHEDEITLLSRQFPQFTMVREDEEAQELLQRFQRVHERLLFKEDDNEDSTRVTSWPIPA